VGARVEIQPTALLVTDGGISVRYNIAAINEGAGSVSVLARAQETTLPLPEPLQRDLEALLYAVGLHMGRLVGLGEESVLEKAAADGRALEEVSPDEEEL
jgi:hypothetical protein